MSAVIPEAVMLPVSRIGLVHDRAPHPRLAAHGAAIDRNWAGEVARNPSLFNGPVLMHRNLVREGDTVSGVSHVVSYASLLYWRRHMEDAADLYHLFGSPVMITSDGAMIVGRMAPTTANAGQVYAPCGSLDTDDIRDGVVDMEANMVREVAEETGFDLSTARAEAVGHLYRYGNRFAFFRRFHLDRPAREVVASFEAFLAAQGQPELSAIYAVRGLETIVADDMPPHMGAFVRFHFEV